MKKNTLTLTIIILIILFVAGCAGQSNSSSHLENINKTKAWQDTYAAFLENLNTTSGNNNYSFGIRNLDDNAVPELIIVKQDDNALNAVLTVYLYDESVKKIGEFSNASTSFVEGFRFSNNPIFTGLFESWHGGGVEHYGYLSIKDGKLTHEELWINDRTVDPPYREEISEDKQLINESINAYPSYEFTDNLLEMHLVSDNNLDEIIKKIVVS